MKSILDSGESLGVYHCGRQLMFKDLMSSIKCSVYGLIEVGTVLFIYLIECMAPFPNYAVNNELIFLSDTNMHITQEGHLNMLTTSVATLILTRGNGMLEETMNRCVEKKEGT